MYHQTRRACLLVTVRDFTTPGSLARPTARPPHKKSVYANPSPLTLNYLGELMNSNGNIYATTKLETLKINGDGVFYV